MQRFRWYEHINFETNNCDTAEVESLVSFFLVATKESCHANEMRRCTLWTSTLHPHTLTKCQEVSKYPHLSKDSQSTLQPCSKLQLSSYFVTSKRLKIPPQSFCFINVLQVRRTPQVSGWQDKNSYNSFSSDQLGIKITLYTVEKCQHFYQHLQEKCKLILLHLWSIS